MGGRAPRANATMHTSNTSQARVDLWASEQRLRRPAFRAPHVLERTRARHRRRKNKHPRASRSPRAAITSLTHIARI
eukprot:8750232-Alexandrium_andersonii.AAC.1